MHVQFLETLIIISSHASIFMTPSEPHSLIYLLETLYFKYYKAERLNRLLVVTPPFSIDVTLSFLVSPKRNDTFM